jgi:hypothetical protein
MCERCSFNDLPLQFGQEMIENVCNLLDEGGVNDEDSDSPLFYDITGMLRR